jgi:hypothetical protein
VAVYPPGFSERVFEFSFNAEFAAANAAVLAGVPHIPTQNEEQYLGYDVAFALNAAGGVSNTVALQHKVARRVDGSGGSNSHFVGKVGIPYLAFRIDADQFNVIESISSAAFPGIEFYYCTPLFTTTAQMDSNYMAKSVAANAIWFDIAGVGPLDVSKPHSIVYPASGVSAWVFSGEPKQLKVHKPRLGRSQETRNLPLQRYELRKIYEFLLPKATEYWLRRRERGKLSAEEEAVKLPTLPPTYEAPSEQRSDVLAIRDLLCNYLGMSVLIEPPLNTPPP